MFVAARYLTDKHGDKDQGKSRETEMQRMQEHHLLHFAQQEEDQGKARTEQILQVRQETHAA